MIPAKHFGLLRTGVWVVPLLMGLIGCNVDPLYPKARRPKGPAMSVSDRAAGGVEVGSEIRVVDRSEVDLVESVINYRTSYLQSLTALRDYYREHGYVSKQSWADFELSGLQKVQTFRYVMDAEIPSDQLRPTDSIPEADALYKRGMKLMAKGGHGIPVFYREGPMIEAVAVFRQLIERYPTSDKIDDAAFQLGEIHKEYLHDQEPIAVKWYERAWTWDPATPHSARFQAAVIYDFRLHDRDRALELYQRVLREETSDWTNVCFSKQRIGELTRETRTARAISTP